MSNMANRQLAALLLGEQQVLRTPVADFASLHDVGSIRDALWRTLIPLSQPLRGEQYAFEVNLDQCTSCKACVAACHSLNGLDDDEAWRNVDILIGLKKEKPYLQTITRACHHCAEPACAHGCPVLAYEKDAVTGVVKHLDDQCIGCSYCVMKCPYDVPKYNKRLGIVRKCDMCQDRLMEGEAPACVQACPNQAIAIRIVKVGLQEMYPAAYPSSYTQPQTRYLATDCPPDALIDAPLSAAESHAPLAVMLVLTQAALGGFFAAAFFRGSVVITVFSMVMLLAGLGASTLHLGQPFKAWKIFLGWRRSWLSREIMAFGAFVGTGAGVVVGVLPLWLTIVAGTAGVYASIMVYVDTNRKFWSMPLTLFRFGGSVIVLGAALASCWNPQLRIAAAVLAGSKVLSEMMWMRSALARDDSAARVINELLRPWWTVRVGLTITGCILLGAFPPVAFTFLIAGEMIERSIFFRAVRS